MTQDGMIVNGRMEESFAYPHPLAPYHRDKEVALLRQSIAEMDAGEQGKSVEEVFDSIERELACLTEDDF